MASFLPGSQGSSLKTRNALAWSYSQQFAALAIQLIGSVVIARLLTPDEVGIFALAVALSAFIAAIRQLGISSYLIREPELNEDKIRTAFGMWLTMSWALGCVILFARQGIAEFYGAPGIADVLLLLAFNFIIGPFGAPAEALLTREMRFDVLNHVTLASSLIGLIASIWLAFSGLSYMALAWGMVITAGLRAVLLILVRSDHLKLRPGFRYWREVLNFGGWLTVSSLLTTANAQGIKFALGAILTPGAVAIFERAVQIPSLARTSVTQPLGNVLAPAYAKLVREGKSIESSLLKVINYSTALIWAPFLALALFPYSVVVGLFGDNWRAASEIMPYLLLAQGITLIMSSAPAVLVAYARVRTLVLASGVVAFGSVGATLYTAHFGLEAFAMSRPFVAFLNFAVFSWAITSASGVKLGEMLRGLPRSAAVAFIASLPALAYRALYSDNVSLFELAAVGLSCAVMWVVTVLVIRHPLSTEFGILSRFFRKGGGAGKDDS